MLVFVGCVSIIASRFLVGILVKVRVFDSPVSGQTPLRFPGIICWVFIPEPFDVMFHRFAFLVSVCHYLLDLVLDRAVGV
jgi:hypothetical protein